MLVNILIRSGGRPELLDRCLKSVEMQTYKNIRVIISTDHGVTDRIREYDHIEVTPDKSHHFFWNKYLNHLKAHVTDGWFFILDDDDMIEQATSIERMTHYLTDPNEAVICQFKRWGKKKPSDEAILNKEITRGKIGMPCIFLHHSKKNVAYFDGQQAADYRFIKTVSVKMPTKFVHHVVVVTDRISGGK
jgi:glycosyltransferase involved in cell wall biosynthesis